jgi:hypothetical protein
MSPIVEFFNSDSNVLRKILTVGSVINELCSDRRRGLGSHTVPIGWLPMSTEPLL